MLPQAYGSAAPRSAHLHTEGLCNPASSKSPGAVFLTAFASFVSQLHFENSRNISNFSIIIIFVMAICDQWSLRNHLWKEELIYGANLTDVLF